MTDTLLTKPSKFHINRSSKNWLIYENCDKMLLRYSNVYRGVLYDFGCGDAPYKEFFLQFADQYIGVDWGEEGYYAANESIAADLNKPIPIESEVADTIVSLSVMEHLYEPENMLNEAFRILKPNGTIVMQVPWQWWIHDAPHDYFRYSPFGLKHMFEKAGFQDITVEPQNGFFSMWVLKFNYFTSRFIFGHKLFRWLVTACLSPIWYLGQLIAPSLDKLDRDWMLETSGYFVTGRKP
ncbi:MAG: class I SAM-dependent methyltransferase [Acidobacteriota bacterium]|nr:class I SAM-dependent methyltransferase [Acidobacteriota bacterium]